MYRILQCTFLVLLGALLATATSAPPRPLKRLSHPRTLSLEILPRRPSAAGTYDKRSYPLDSPELRHDDTFRLRLSAFGDTFHLHLRPNEHLIHPAARISYYTTDADGRSVLDRTEPLLPQSVKAYWGEVVEEDASEGRMREDAAGVWPRPAGKFERGWARIVVHHQGDPAAGLPPSFEGAFSVDGVVHHVMTQDNYLRTKLTLDPHILSDDPDSSLVIFRDSDVMTPYEYRVVGSALDTSFADPPPRTCAHDKLDFNTNPLVNPVLRRPPPVTPWYDPFHFLRNVNSTLARRDDVAGGGYTTNFADNIGQSAGCPSTQRVVYMGVAADCVYTSQYGSTQNASQQIISTFNTASALYKSTFNVSLGIIELQVHDPTCPSQADPATPWNIPCQTSVTLNDRLSLFSDWRGQKGNDGAGLWHLMSGCPTGTEVGIAWLGTLCQQTAGGDPGNIVSGTAVSTAGRVEWQVVAHEIGHNFGAIHDCASGCASGANTGQCCPFSTTSCDATAQFIMSPVAETNEMKFSPCSLGNICSLMLASAAHSTNTTCLIDASSAKHTISLQMCGNGIVEDGEDCDPGQGVNSSCCDAKTCKFKAGAVCDPMSSPCCTGQCTFAPSTQVCRPQKDANCDQPEMCTGNSSACPADVFSPNGKSCGPNGLACASGTCTSLATQCQTVGASLGLSKACPANNDKSCQVSCQDPSSSNSCIVLQSPLIDGSPCGYGGTCQQGSCKSGSVLDTVKAWYTQNLQISIPVTVVAGLIFLLILSFIIRAILRCCRRRTRPSSMANLKNSRGQRLASWDSPPAMGQVPYAYGSYGPNAPTQQPQYAPPQYAPPPVHTHGRSDGWPGSPPNGNAHRTMRSDGSDYYRGT